MIPQIITITGEESIETVYTQFAVQQGIDTSHVIVVRPEKDELTVDQIHLMQKDIQPAFVKKVLVVLQAVDASSIEVQNSLLKCLEEDAERIQFLFLVKNHAKLLPTILSRCSFVPQAHHPHPYEKQNSSEVVFSFQNNSDTTKEEAIAKIDAYIEFSVLKNSHTLYHLLSIRKLISENNMNPVLALDNILIFLSKTSTMSVTHEK